MEDAVIVLGMLFVLVMVSFFLDGCSCSLVSQSSFAIIFGVVCGIFITYANNTTLDHHMDFNNNVFFYLLLPPIIYEAGFSVNTRSFFSNLGSIITTAVFGTLIATCITGGILYAAGQYDIVTQLSWVEAFLFGSLISAIDPVATLACFNKLNAPPLLFNMVFGESVLNDAVAIVLYQTLHKWDPNNEFNVGELISVAYNMGGMFVGSLLVSAVITLSGAFLLKRKCMSRMRRFPVYEISLCLIFSLMTYFMADMLSFSGIVALFFSGTMTAHYHFYTISPEAQHSFTHLLHTLAFVSESLVYVLMGTSVVLVFAGIHKTEVETIELKEVDWNFIGLTFGGCLVARFFNTFPLLSLANCWRNKNDRLSCKYMFVIWFAGLRGAIAFALAKTWDKKGIDGISHRHLILSTTLAIMLFTTIIIGGLTGTLLTCLHLTDRDDGGMKLELNLSPTSEDMTDNESKDSTPTLSSAPSNRRINRPKRRSSHYLVHTGDRSSENVSSNQVTEGTGSCAVLTPRPQFRKQISFRIGMGIGTVSEDEELPEYGYCGSKWNYFDDRYLKPLFGGKGQHLRDQHLLSPKELITNAAIGKFSEDRSLRLNVQENSV